jgi:hypothetical protein
VIFSVSDIDRIKLKYKLKSSSYWSSIIRPGNLLPKSISFIVFLLAVSLASVLFVVLWETLGGHYPAIGTISLISRSQFVSNWGAPQSHCWGSDSFPNDPLEKNLGPSFLSEHCSSRPKILFGRSIEVCVIFLFQPEREVKAILKRKRWGLIYLCSICGIVANP